jgi:hypothetical protein
MQIFCANAPVSIVVSSVPNALFSLFDDFGPDGTRSGTSAQN